MTRIGKSVEIESRLVVPGARRLWGEREVSAKGYRVSFWGDGNVLN